MCEIEYPGVQAKETRRSTREAQVRPPAERKPVKIGLRAKLGLLMLVITLISIIFYTIVIYNFQTNELVENAKNTSAILSQTVMTSLEHALVTNNWDMAANMIQAFDHQNVIERVQIINTAGEVVTSSIEGEAGLHYPLSGSPCQSCHAQASMPEQKTTIYTNSSGERAFLDVNVMYNRQECYACHDPSQRVLGLLILETSLEEMQEQIEKHSLQTILFSLGMAGLMFGFMIPVLNQSFLRPISKLSKGILDIHSGNLDTPVRSIGDGELEQLANSFNDMRMQLKKVHQEMERREQEALTLSELGVKISSSLALDEVLDEVARAARLLLNADVGVVGLLEQSEVELVIKAAAGDESHALVGQRIPIKLSPGGSLRVAGKPVRAEVYEPGEPLHPEALSQEGQLGSFLAVPLQRGEKFLGVVEVMSRAARHFETREEQLLMRLANQVVVSVENAELHRKFRYLAILEERNRLAREMHDHLAQALGYLNVKASITAEQLKMIQVEQAQESLDEMKRVLKVIYTDVREAIFNLRTSISSEMEFIPTLSDYLHEYWSYYGLKAQLDVSPQELGEISTEVGNQLLCIVQEALTNVRKHAAASLVRILIDQEQETLCLTIEDDGRGFEATSTHSSTQSYGLQIMRERAESVGGTLEIVTSLGLGTRIEVRVPALPIEFT